MNSSRQWQSPSVTLSELGFSFLCGFSSLFCYFNLVCCHLSVSVFHILRFNFGLSLMFRKSPVCLKHSREWSINFQNIPNSSLDFTDTPVLSLSSVSKASKLMSSLVFKIIFCHTYVGTFYPSVSKLLFLLIVVLLWMAFHYFQF